MSKPRSPRLPRSRPKARKRRANVRPANADELADWKKRKKHRKPATSEAEAQWRREQKRTKGYYNSVAEQQVRLQEQAVRDALDVLLEVHGEAELEFRIRSKVMGDEDLSDEEYLYYTEVMHETI